MSRLIFSVIFFLFICGIYWLVVMKGALPKVLKKKTPERKPTMFDVRRQLQEGNRSEAIKLYIRIFRVSYRKAKKDIEDLERNLKV